MIIWKTTTHYGMLRNKVRGVSAAGWSDERYASRGSRRNASTKGQFNRVIIIWAGHYMLLPQRSHFLLVKCTRVQVLDTTATSVVEQSPLRTAQSTTATTDRKAISPHKLMRCYSASSVSSCHWIQFRFLVLGSICFDRVQICGLCRCTCILFYLFFSGRL